MWGCELYMWLGRAIAQVVSRRHLTVEALARAQGSITDPLMSMCWAPFTIAESLVVIVSFFF
jgi:hypothetical protein